MTVITLTQAQIDRVVADLTSHPKKAKFSSKLHTTKGRFYVDGPEPLTSAALARIVAAIEEES